MNTKYRAAFAPLLFYHMQRGHSFESFAALDTDKQKLLEDDPPGVWAKDQPDFRKHPVSPEIVQEWIDKHPAFAQARATGEAASLLFLEKRLEEALIGKIKGDKPADTRALIFALAGRFPDVYAKRRSDRPTHTDVKSAEIDIRYINDPKALAAAARSWEKRAKRPASPG